MPRPLVTISIIVLLVSSIGLWRFALQGALPLLALLPKFFHQQAPNATNDLGYWTENHTGSVTLRLADHNATNVKIGRPVTSAEDLLERTWGTSTRNEERCSVTNKLKWTKMRCKEMLQTSLNITSLSESSYIPMSNGFVDSVIRAYNEHHHLVIRPDDVWIAILSQLNLYINANAEGLRDKLVSHEGKRTLKIESFGDRHNFDYAGMADTFSEMLKRDIKEPKFHEMITPTFSTTTDTDRVVASALMMSTFKKYYNYVVSFMCGIPTLTILGTPYDYQSILDRLDTLDSLNLGPEPRAFTTMLRPIARQFMATSANSLHMYLDMFWERICQPVGISSGPEYLGGWIAAFSVWDSDGQWQGGDLELVSKPLTPKEQVEFAYKAKRIANPPNPWSIEKPPQFVYDDVRYPVIPLGNIANGFGDVDIRIEEADGKVLEGMMVAGHVGALARKSNETEGNEGILDTLQPSPQWFMFVEEKLEKNYGQYDKYDW